MEAITDMLCFLFSFSFFKFYVHLLDAFTFNIKVLHCKKFPEFKIFGEKLYLAFEILWLDLYNIDFALPGAVAEILFKQFIDANWPLLTDRQH